MSNWVDCQLDVLASSQNEMNHIAERLNKPSQELANWLAQRLGQPVSEAADFLKKLLQFKNLGRSDSKDRRFSIAFRDTHWGTVRSHLFEVSQGFPAAIFLFEYRDGCATYRGKQVIRAGEVVQEVLDGDKRVGPWALLDIFAPFREEYHGGEAEFGSLWQPWIEAVIAAARQLKDDQTPARQRSTEVTGQSD
jgi:hypothetical protein